MDEDLRRLAGVALKKAKEDLVRTGTVDPTIMMREPDGTLQVIRMGETGAVMNSGKGKDLLFGALREIVKEKGITAVIFATDGWMGKQTAKGRAIGEEEFFRKTRERAFETAVREGLVERCEVITLTVQTPMGTLMVQQEYERGIGGKRSITFGEQREQEVGVDEFTGRQKMYGDLREENLG